MYETTALIDELNLKIVWCTYEETAKLKLKRLPEPGLDSALMLPPWASINSLQIASPSPVPSFVPGTRK